MPALAGGPGRAGVLLGNTTWSRTAPDSLGGSSSSRPLGRVCTSPPFQAAGGKTLWHFHPQGSAIGGASVVNGVVYWGDGYAHLGIPGWTPATTFYAFSLNGR